MFLAFAVMAIACVSCAGSAQNISKEQEAAWRKGPPATPPPEYKGNMLGVAKGPPPSANGPGAGAAASPQPK